MRTVFCDTSGFFAVANPSDKQHALARRAWQALLDANFQFVTSNYVLVESISLMQARSGLKVVRAFCAAIEGLVDVAWIDPPLHDAALHELLSSGRRRLSLVDCASFAFMRRHRITAAFAFDAHFEEQGFALPAVD